MHYRGRYARSNHNISGEFGGNFFTQRRQTVVDSVPLDTECAKGLEQVCAHIKKLKSELPFCGNQRTREPVILESSTFETSCYEQDDAVIAKMKHLLQKGVYFTEENEKNRTELENEIQNWQIRNHCELEYAERFESESATYLSQVEARKLLLKEIYDNVDSLISDPSCERAEDNDGTED